MFIRLLYGIFFFAGCGMPNFLFATGDSTHAKKENPAYPKQNEIRTHRTPYLPTQVVGRGVFQVETGVTFAYCPNLIQLDAPVVNLRVGLNRWLDIGLSSQTRFMWMNNEYNVFLWMETGYTLRQKALSGPGLSAKACLFYQRGLRPALAIKSELKLNSLSVQASPSNALNNVNINSLAMGWKWKEKNEIIINAHHTQYLDTERPHFAFSLAYEGYLTNRIRLFVQGAGGSYLGEFPVGIVQMSGQEFYRGTLGGLFSISPNCVLNMQYTRIERNTWFTNEFELGLTWRIHTAKMVRISPNHHHYNSI